MTSIQSRSRRRKEHISEAPSEPSLSARSDYKSAVSPIVDPGAGPVGPIVAKYTEEDLQQILKAVLEAQVPASNEPLEKLLKARSPDVYCNHFATAGAKDPNRIPFTALFLRDRINFWWQQYKQKQDSSIPISWDKFKAFLRRSLGDFQAFIDSYWAKIKRDSQYQQEDVLDWAAHLEHLQAVLREFDSVAAPNDDSLIWYFREGLRPSIRAQLDARGRELDSWDEVVEKTINAEAKASLQLYSRTRKMDSKCPRDELPVKSDDLSEPKEKTKFPHIFSANWGSDQMSDEMSDRSPGKKDSGPHCGSYQGSRQSSHRSAKNLSHITCFNCDQKGHYTTQCPKPSEGFNVFEKPSGNDPSCNDSSSESNIPDSIVQDQDPQA